jgi:FkbH-like protein
MDKAKLHVYTNYTTHPLVQILNNELKKNKLKYEIIQGEFDSAFSQILNSLENSTYSSNDIIFVQYIPKLSSNLVLNHKNLEKFKAQINQDFQSIVEISKRLDKNIVKKIILCNFGMPSNFNNENLFTNDLNLLIIKEVIKINRQINDLGKSNSKIFILDFFEILNKCGLEKSFNHKFNTIAKIPVTDMVFQKISEAIARNLVLTVRKKKCIVLDLDNTLWGGVVGESGVKNLELHENYPGISYIEFQNYLLYLKETGVILAISSKNNLPDVKAAFEQPNMVLKLDDFSAIEVNWNEKSRSLKAIAKKLQIGLDSVCFFDDSKYEREEVIANLPEVHTFEVPTDPFRYSETIAKSGLFFQPSIFQEDLERSATYSSETKREKVSQNYTNHSDFLKSLSMKVTFETLNSNNFERAIQLIDKTNQFNVSGIRSNNIDLGKRSPNHTVLFSLEDKFGSYGRVGIVSFSSGNEDIIDIFNVSCRALNRNLEFFMLYVTYSKFMDYDTKANINFKKTDRNIPAEKFLLELFSKVKENNTIDDTIKDKVNEKIKGIFNG